MMLLLLLLLLLLPSINLTCYACMCISPLSSVHVRGVKPVVNSRVSCCCCCWCCRCVFRFHCSCCCPSAVCCWMDEYSVTLVTLLLPLSPSHSPRPLQSSARETRYFILPTARSEMYDCNFGCSFVSSRVDTHLVKMSFEKQSCLWSGAVERGKRRQLDWPVTEEWRGRNDCRYGERHLPTHRVDIGLPEHLITFFTDAV